MSLWTMTDEAAGAPKFTAKASTGETGTALYGTEVFGVDATEAQVAANAANGLNTPGWVKYNTYTDANGNVRHKSEVLVAGGSMGPDTGLGDDTVVPDA